MSLIEIWHVIEIPCQARNDVVCQAWNDGVCQAWNDGVCQARNDEFSVILNLIQDLMSLIEIWHVITLFLPIFLVALCLF
jgi:hypothetical protein